MIRKKTFVRLFSLLTYLGIALVAYMLIIYQIQTINFWNYDFFRALGIVCSVLFCIMIILQYIFDKGEE
jgi:hypothetical protein